MNNNIKSLIIHIPIIIVVIFLNLSHISKTNSDGIVGAIGLPISVIISLWNITLTFCPSFLLALGACLKKRN